MAKKSDNSGSESESDKLNTEDTALFREMVGDVKPLTPDNKIEPTQINLKPIPTHIRREQSTQLSTAQPSFIQSEYVNTVTPEQTLFFSRPGLQQKVTQRLRRGQVPVEAQLDLHGYTIQDAAQELEGFIAAAREAGFRCVIVVHGKGHRSSENRPVLKSQVNHWLQLHPEVMAFSSAMPKDGGVGAVYVLLKKLKEVS